MKAEKIRAIGNAVSEKSAWKEIIVKVNKVPNIKFSKHHTFSFFIYFSKF